MPVALVAALVVMMTTAGCASSVQSGTTEAKQVVTQSRPLPLLGLRTGECVNRGLDAASDPATPDPAATPVSPRIVSCSTPHQGEVYLTFTMAGASYPGLGAVFRQVATRCPAAFRSFIGIESGQSRLNSFAYAPTSATWNVAHGRDVSCLVADPSGTTTRSLAGAAR